MLIPIDQLAPKTLRRVVEEYVTRDGTETGDSEAMIEQVLTQLRSGKAELHYDEESETTMIVAKR